MQLSKKEKQTLQEKYKAQRQAMWSGKQAASQDAEEKTAEADQAAPIEPPEPTETASKDRNQAESSVQTESDAAATPLAENTGAAEEGDASEGGRVFWEAGQEGSANIVTWKLILAVIGVAIVLVGVGVWLGFLVAS